MNDRDFWLTVRRALLMIVKAIERRYPSKAVELDIGDSSTTLSYLSDDS
jgi:hypothetical protein